ncbi:hypothetical protein Ciccas_014172, partial [Cichlidogyrus casuarinus]
SPGLDRRGWDADDGLQSDLATGIHKTAAFEVEGVSGENCKSATVLASQEHDVEKVQERVMVIDSHRGRRSGLRREGSDEKFLDCN